jgi:hypothetical protein
LEDTEEETMFLIAVQIALTYLVSGIAVLCIFEYFGIVQKNLFWSASEIERDLDQAVEKSVRIIRAIAGSKYKPLTPEDLEIVRENGRKSIAFKLRAKLVLGHPWYLVRFVFSNF